MKNKFSKIALSSTSQDESIMSIARQIFEILSNVGVETLYDDNLSGLEEQIGKKSLSVEQIIQNADLLIAIGGDGTMLNCSQKYGSKGIPILGINLGKLGFLTDIAPDEITTRLIDVVKGKFVEDKRFFLEASLIIISKFPPNWISVPRPAIFVAIVIVPGAPACAIICASCSW